MLPTNPEYLLYPKCNNIMRLQNDADESLVVGSGSGGTATAWVNSTGTINSSQIWYIYYCLSCGETAHSPYRFQEPE